MAFVETERHGQIMVIRMNRPERLNALGQELRQGLAQAWCEFRDSEELEVAIFTGTGRAFCAGEDMKESLVRGTPGRGPQALADPFMDGALPKPVEFIPIKPLAATDSNAPGSCAGHSRVPSPDHGPLVSIGGSGL